MSAAIELHGVSVRYREVLALHDATISVGAGEVCGLIGVNGSGKSTLLKAVAGLVPLSAGRVTVLGRSPADVIRDQSLGYVPQSEQVDRDFPLSVREVVMMGRYGRMGWLRRPRRTDVDAVQEALAKVELLDLAHRQIGQLSGGQLRRVFVARGLAQQADVLLLDEPFAGVDRASEATIQRVLRELAARGGTVLIATHDLDNLAQVCDNAVLLHQRVLLQADPVTVTAPENLARAFGIPVGGRS